MESAWRSWLFDTIWFKGQKKVETRNGPVWAEITGTGFAIAGDTTTMGGLIVCFQKLDFLFGMKVSHVKAVETKGKPNTTAFL